MNKIRSVSYEKQTNKLLEAYYSTIPINFMVVNTNGNIDVNAGEKPVVYTAGMHYRPIHMADTRLCASCVAIINNKW